MYDLGMGQYLPGESSHSVVSNHIYNQITQLLDNPTEWRPTIVINHFIQDGGPKRYLGWFITPSIYYKVVPPELKIGYNPIKHLPEDSLYIYIVIYRFYIYRYITCKP